MALSTYCITGFINQEEILAYYEKHQNTFLSDLSPTELTIEGALLQQRLYLSDKPIYALIFQPTGVLPLTKEAFTTYQNKRYRIRTLFH